MCPRQRPSDCHVCALQLGANAGSFSICMWRLCRTPHRPLAHGELPPSCEGERGHLYNGSDRCLADCCSACCLMLLAGAMHGACHPCFSGCSQLSALLVAWAACMCKACVRVCAVCVCVCVCCVCGVVHGWCGGGDQQCLQMHACCFARTIPRAAPPCMSPAVWWGLRGGCRGCSPIDARSVQAAVA